MISMFRFLSHAGANRPATRRAAWRAVLWLLPLLELSYAPDAQAAFTMNLYECGTRVIADGRGSFIPGPTQTSGQAFQQIRPSLGQLYTGGTFSAFNNYVRFGVSGPGSFGPGATAVAPNTASGSYVALIASFPSIGIPPGYVSGSPITSGGIFNNRTLAGLGVTVGSHTWTWGSDETADSYTLVASETPPFPTAISVLPVSGATTGGTVITLSGCGFSGATAITVGGTACTSFSVIDDTTATCTTPEGSAGSASVEVTTADGTNAANTLFTYEAAVEPTASPTPDPPTDTPTATTTPTPTDTATQASTPTATATASPEPTGTATSLPTPSFTPWPLVGTYTVGSQVTVAQVLASGGQGGETSSLGGPGCRVTASLPVVAGDVFSWTVGQDGGPGVFTGAAQAGGSGGVGPYPGGAGGSSVNGQGSPGGGGGAATQLSLNGAEIVVAAGGGGASQFGGGAGCGSNNGGPSGGGGSGPISGTGIVSSVLPGGGSTPSAGGAGGRIVFTSGLTLTGANGNSATDSPPGKGGNGGNPQVSGTAGGGGGGGVSGGGGGFGQPSVFGANSSSGAAGLSKAPTPAAGIIATSFVPNGLRQSGSVTINVVTIALEIPTGAVGTVYSGSVTGTFAGSEVLSGDIAQYSVTPELPAGLAMDPATGAISGTPTEVSPSTTYTVSVSRVVPPPCECFEWNGVDFVCVKACDPAAPSCNEEEFDVGCCDCAAGNRPKAETNDVIATSVASFELEVKDNTSEPTATSVPTDTPDPAATPTNAPTATPTETATLATATPTPTPVTTPTATVASCDACSGGSQVVDYVFLVEGSLSMRLKIDDGVRLLGPIPEAAAALGHDYRIAVLRFGTRPKTQYLTPELLQDFTTDGEAVRAALRDVKVKLVTPTESGTEALDFMLDNLSFRPGAMKVVVLVTDEDDDLPVSLQTRASGREPPTNWLRGARRTIFQNRIDAVSQRLVEENVRLLLVVRSREFPSDFQYGTPSLQVFDSCNRVVRAASFDKMRTKQREQSLQGRLLSSGGCTAGSCTQGSVGRSCDTDLDCGLYVRSFEIQDVLRGLNRNKGTADEDLVREMLQLPLCDY